MLLVNRMFFLLTFHGHLTTFNWEQYWMCCTTTYINTTHNHIYIKWILLVNTIDARNTQWSISPTVTFSATENKYFPVMKKGLGLEMFILSLSTDSAWIDVSFQQCQFLFITDFQLLLIFSIMFDAFGCNHNNDHTQIKNAASDWQNVCIYLQSVALFSLDNQRKSIS